MRFYVAWLNDAGGLNGPVDHNEFYEDYVPLVGDFILVHWRDIDDDVTADRVVERYITYDPDNVPVWLLVLEHTEVPPDRADFARRVRSDFAARKTAEKQRVRAEREELVRSFSLKPK